ncbi:MAG TPA: TetR/AcrR family transcriptional regulator [Pirellulales bacterium]|jgi:TetR/AcrR family transcriptional repressor of nem operon|nr:TetR/AcrR family transcriptional regulator [Pirellulales bacterium]
MRYTSDHKRQTHERIVAEASRLFREEGYKGSSVDAVMQAAQLTPGGFYAHFEDKDALLAEVLESCILRQGRRLAADAPLAEGSFEDWIDYYLSTGHLNRPGSGCPLPSLTSEIARQPAKVRRAFTEAMRLRLAELSRAAPGDTEEIRSERAIATLASVMGAVTLARALDDPSLGDRILRTVRGAVLAQLGLPQETPQETPQIKPQIKPQEESAASGDLADGAGSQAGPARKKRKPSRRSPAATE